MPQFSDPGLLAEMIGRIGRIVLRPEGQVRYVLEQSTEGWTIRRETLDERSQVIEIAYLERAETKEWTHSASTHHALFSTLEEAGDALAMFDPTLLGDDDMFENIWTRTSHIVFPRSARPTACYSIMAVRDDSDGKWFTLADTTALPSGLIERVQYQAVAGPRDRFNCVEYDTLEAVYLNGIRIHTNPDRTTGA